MANLDQIVLEGLQTLYSFRHSGAIEIYKRPGSLTILQQAMGRESSCYYVRSTTGFENAKALIYFRSLKYHNHERIT